VSEADAHGTGSGGTTLERGREEVLDAARPLPPMRKCLSVTSLRTRIASSLRPS
jgi:hypothetical protein